MNSCVFLDASFWIAFRDGRQDLHEYARETMTGLLRQRIQFVTTLPVLCEIHAHFSRRAKQRLLLIDDFENNALIRLESIAHTDQQHAFQLLQRQADKSYSLCDAISFIVMRRLNIRRAISFDKHFRQFGELEVIPNKFP